MHSRLHMDPEHSYPECPPGDGSRFVRPGACGGKQVGHTLLF